MEHNCDEIYKKIILLLDNELTTEEQDWLRDQLIACPSCLENYESEKEFKDMLCEKLKCMDSCECNEDQLKKKILDKIRNRGLLPE